MLEQQIPFPQKTVAIVFRYIPQYRKEFYERLREVLNQRNIELKLIYGQPGKTDALKEDKVTILWGIRIKNYVLQFGNKAIYWQPIFSHIKDADLVIVEPASKLLVNYPLILLSKLNNRKIAFWGMGKNFQSTSAIPLSEWVKRIITKQVHWYFAYTERSSEIIQGYGFPLDHITVVQNSIDTQNLVRARELITNEELAVLKGQLGLKGDNIGLYVGGMYKEKKLEFLLESCKLIRLQIPDFEMLMIGSGVDAPIVMEFARGHPWLHYLGPKYDEEKVPYFAISKLFLMPGLVGLGILDCFSLGIPLVTTQNPDHSPEVDYLINDINGIIVEDYKNPLHYANVVSNLIINHDRLNDLIVGCKASARKYSTENMVHNFSEGIIKAIFS